MKILIASALATVLAATASYAEVGAKGEIGYPQGSIGYDALVAGDNDRAIGQILASNQISRHDPARLINLGQAYARTGRVAEARTMFNAALEKREAVDLILADGRVMDSHDAARQALSKLQARMASR